jgi:AcrR family transcriptional regulator
MYNWSNGYNTMNKSTNEEREQRILDAAADLFVHYGYDKTAVSDIAREAGISKGAIYLHFKSKDELLEALIIRETEKYADTWLALINDDPHGGTIGGMYKNSLYALNSSEFMAATFRKDGRILGNYLRKPGNFFQAAEGKQTARYDFVKMMQEAGAVRQDINPEIIAHIMNMLSYGLIAMSDIMPQENIPPFDEIVEGIALVMDGALIPAGYNSNETGKTILNEIANTRRLQHSQLRDNA